MRLHQESDLEARINAADKKLADAPECGPDCKRAAGRTLIDPECNRCRAVKDRVQAVADAAAALEYVKLFGG